MFFLPRVSLLITQGIDIKTVANKAGHSRTSTTLNIYSHAIKSADAMAADALDGILIPKTERMVVLRKA